MYIIVVRKILEITIFSLIFVDLSCIIVVMYVVEIPYTSKTGKTYRSVLLRESYREGSKVRNRTIANLSKCTPQEITAIKLALKHKEDIAFLFPDTVELVQLQKGSSVGAVWAVYQIAERLGVQKALGNQLEGKLALWQVIARVIEQGSRLSAVRLARTHAACDVLGINDGFNEDDLYDNLRWLAVHQKEIEQKLFSKRHGKAKPGLFYYDVTSSYLEGEHNQLAAYGYNRDKKKGKMQIVIGLLCDEQGEPVSVDVFSGNTQDPNTVSCQIQNVTELFGCHHVIFVGDRGMVKSKQIQFLTNAELYYITAITKPQIETLIKSGVLRLDMFSESVHEVFHVGVRYILRRNAQRAEELKATYHSKRKCIEELVDEQNVYLLEHKGAEVSVALGKVSAKIEQLKVQTWLKVRVEGRVLCLEQDEKALQNESRLDGCYVIKTDVPQDIVHKQIIHDRYKDLSEVESAFRTCKTGHLEMRPVYVQTKESTRGHILVVMLAYLVVRELSRRWSSFDMTVQEGLSQLSMLCAMEMRVNNSLTCLKFPKPCEQSRKLLEALGVTFPSAFPHKEVNVVTKKQLNQKRKKP